MGLLGRVPTGQFHVLSSQLKNPTTMLFVAPIFLILLFTGVVRGELEWPHLLGFVLSAGGALALILAMQWPLIWYAAVLALLDVMLVIWIFKGNPRIS